MNWFQRHLNWTYVLGWLLMLVLLFILGFVLAVIDSNISEDALDTIGNLIGGIFMLVVSGWVIIQKGRSLWWLLMAGWFSPLWLSNKRMESELLDSQS